MKQIFVCVLLTLILASCKRDSSVFLARRWNFVGMDMPKLGKFVEQINEEGDSRDLTIQKFLLDNKLILRKDSSFDLLLMKQYVHGTWRYDQQKRILHLNDESAKKLSIQFGVDTVNGRLLHLDTDEFVIERLAVDHLSDPAVSDYLFRKSYYQFFLEEDPNYFSNLSDDPYSKENNWWRVKPSQPETDRQIKNRVLDHLKFWQLLFHDANKFDRPFVSYNWFSSPLVVASNGVVMKLYADVKKEWDENFYDSVQAQKGYELMRKCFSKKIKYMDTDNKYLRDEDIIKQLTANFVEATTDKEN